MAATLTQAVFDPLLVLLCHAALPSSSSVIISISHPKTIIVTGPCEERSHSPHGWMPSNECARLVLQDSALLPGRWWPQADIWFFTIPIRRQTCLGPLGTAMRCYVGSSNVPVEKKVNGQPKAHETTFNAVRGQASAELDSR